MPETYLDYLHDGDETDSMVNGISDEDYYSAFGELLYGEPEGPNSI